MKRLAADGRVGFKRLPPDRFAEIHAQGVAAFRAAPHPRGMSGKRHSVEARAKMSVGQQRLVANGLHVGQRPKTERQRQAVAEANARRLTSGGNVYSRARRGRRDDLRGIFFRSSWEANYARFLEWQKQRGLIADWEYEPETFWFEKIRRGVRSYTPDFRVTENTGSRYYVEVKGWMDAKSKTKLKRMAKYHPAVDLRVIDAKAYREIDRKLGGAIPNWERAA
jgi:hypothetical protein